MFKNETVKAVRLAAVGAALIAVGACTTVEEEMKLSTLEEKVNEALQAAAAAKVDATTALNIAVDVEMMMMK